LHRRLVSDHAVVLVVAAVSLSVVTVAAHANSDGGKLWLARYDGEASGADVATSVAVSPDGAVVFVTGYGPGTGTSDDFETVAYDADTGLAKWVSRFDGPAHESDIAHSVTVSPDGTRVFVTGTSLGPHDEDFATVALDAATGLIEWSRLYDGAGHLFDEADQVVVSPDGSNIFVTGGSIGATDYDFATVAYDAGTGSTLWVDRFDGPSNGYDFARSIAVSPDGSKVFVTGEATFGAATDGDYATLAYDAATGARLWLGRYAGWAHAEDQAQRVVAGTDGSKVFVTGRSYGRADDYATVAYDSGTGAHLWAKRYDGHGHGDDDANDLTESPDRSSVIVTGQSHGAGASDFATISYDAATGSVQWIKRFNGESGGGGAISVLTSPGGTEAYVTGSVSMVPGADDYATVAYDLPTGRQLGVRRYSSPGLGGNDVPHASAVSPDGSKFFVTGAAVPGSTGWDFVTVAYAV